VNVCGISVLTRKRIVVRRFGTDAWKRFYGDVAGAHSCFRSFITADSFVPLPAYLAFHDELMRRFFKEDERSYLEMGRESSRWALTEGPLKAFLEGRDLKGFVASLPNLHKLYFAGATTWSEAFLTSTGVDFKVFGLPQWHPYFEYFIVGYIAEALEMFCANPIRTVRLHGGTGSEYHYLFHGMPSAAGTRVPLVTARSTPRTPSGPSSTLSGREMEVVQLAAYGKTNEEIGVALDISKKTAQHHLARAYRKLGVSGRVGATVWLAERGLLSTDSR
jgi:DNA-binding CsgD family transcriptional regulator